MPDLNLLDDVGFEEESTPTPASKKSKPTKQKSTGGGSSVLLILLIIILVLGAAAYFLNQKGIIRLWGKKKAPITQIEEEPFPPVVQEEQRTIAPPQPQQQDTTQIALLDTSFAEQGSENLKESDKELSLAERGDLASMQGEYTVQVIAFKERKQAEEVRENLEAAGYPAFVEKVALKNGAWYRVCIGKYPTREDAKKAVLTFGSQLRSNYIIDKITQR